MLNIAISYIMYYNCIRVNMILYHGSPYKIVTPTYGRGEERHDYGKGFYLTADLELAKEWAVCRPDSESGYVHTFDLGEADERISGMLFKRNCRNTGKNV